MVVTKYHVIVYYESSFIPVLDKKLMAFLDNRDYLCDDFSIETCESTPASCAHVHGIFSNEFEADYFNVALIAFLEKSPNHNVVY